MINNEKQKKLLDIIFANIEKNKGVPLFESALIDLEKELLLKNHLSFLTDIKTNTTIFNKIAQQFEQISKNNDNTFKEQNLECLLKKAQKLKEKACDPNPADNKGNSAIFYAANSNDNRLLQLLLTDNYPDKKSFPNINHKNQQEHTILTETIINNNLANAHIILSERYPLIDVNSQDSYGNTALHHACMQNNFEAFKLLICFCADTTITNQQNQNPVDLSQSQEIKEWHTLWNKINDEQKCALMTFWYDNDEGDLLKSHTLNYPNLLSIAKENKLDSVYNTLAPIFNEKIVPATPAAPINIKKKKDERYPGQYITPGYENFLNGDE